MSFTIIYVPFQLASPPHKRVRYGIIGFGHFAERAIAPAIRASGNSELVAIQKRSLSSARAKAAEYSIPVASDSVKELVSHPEIDAVFIVSANAMHCPETLVAASAGKHVIVEKPMAMNSTEAEQMIEACRNSGVKLMVGHMLRFSPLVRRMQEIVSKGLIEDVVFAHSEFMYDAALSQRSWLLDMKLAGGGPVFDIGVHCLDTMRFILRDQVASASSQLQPRPAVGTEKNAVLALRFSKGAIGSIFCSFTGPYRRTFIEIVGTGGTISAFDFTHSDATVPLKTIFTRDGMEEKAQVEEIVVPNLYVEEITSFSQSILDNEDPVVPGNVGLDNQRVLDEAMK